MNNKNIIRYLKGLSCGLITIIFCFVFANSNSIWSDNLDDRMSNMTVDDIQLTVIDEDTVQLENLIKGNGVTYSWIIKNSLDGIEINSVARVELEENEVIEFTVEDVDVLEVQAVVSYNDYIYTSQIFYVDEDGSLSVSEENSASSVSYEASITRDIGDIVSLAFLCFLTFSVVLYYIVPKRFQWIVLLGASIIFYTVSGIEYIIFIITSALITYLTTRKMSERKELADQKINVNATMKEKKALKNELQKENKQLLYIALFGTLGIMVVIKYTSFIVNNINAILHTDIEMLTLLMPIGLSFYTFMLIAYTMDVYRGKYKAEQSFSRFFLFISFFPHVSQGPIARYDETANQFREEHRFEYDNICSAAQRILWGFFVKLVIADRIAIVVNTVYDNYKEYSWLMLILASMAYSIQIYADFYSSMEIAIGSAQMFGIRLTENFLRPYFATSMPEFWRRWHATLGTWFKDYVFYPISISKRLMKFNVKVRKKFGPEVARVIAAAPPIMGVWILTGLWHGSSWKFIAWGLFHGTLILLSTAFSGKMKDVLEKIGIQTETWDYKIMQMFKVFVLCTIGRVFFRANSFMESLSIFKRILTFANPNKLIDFTGVDLIAEDYTILFWSLAALLGVSIVRETVGSVRLQISKANIWMRWSIWFVLILAVLIYGIYGPGTVAVFLYEAF